MRRQRRAGFSLVELLVVIGILALLAALTVAAVQKVRESANRLNCASNLRQLGLSAHLYHDAQERLPPGYLGPAPVNNANSPRFYFEGQWIGHFPLLLPYLEQDGIRRQIEVNFNPLNVFREKWFWSAPASGPGPPNVGNYTAAMKDLKFFRCPSVPNYTPEFNNPSRRGGGTLLGLHVFNDRERRVFTVGWRDEYGSAAAYRPLGRTNYMGVAGCGVGTHPLFSPFEGIYTNRTEHTLGQAGIPDGTSYTLLYRETCGSRWQSGPDTRDISWMAGGGLGTYLGLQRGREALVIAFSSYHPAGIQFCFADGSVRMLRFGNSQWNGRNMNALTDEWYVLQRLAGRKDGSVVEVTSLTD